MVKPLRVLEIITVPIAENGLALYPIRMAEKMDARVQIDFLACYAEPELKTRIENRARSSISRPAGCGRPFRICGLWKRPCAKTAIPSYTPTEIRARLRWI